MKSFILPQIPEEELFPLNYSMQLFHCQMMQPTTNKNVHMHFQTYIRELSQK